MDAGRLDVREAGSAKQKKLKGSIDILLHKLKVTSIDFSFSNHFLSY